MVDARTYSFDSRLFTDKIVQIFELFNRTYVAREKSF